MEGNKEEIAEQEEFTPQLASSLDDDENVSLDAGNGSGVSGAENDSVSLTVGSRLSRSRLLAPSSPQPSTAFKVALDLDKEAAKFIDEKLPRFFGVIAAKHQASVIRGRHPKSLPRDSELWHYNKVSGQRRVMIQRGQHLWDVLDKEKLQPLAEKSDMSRSKSISGGLGELSGVTFGSTSDNVIKEDGSFDENDSKSDYKPLITSRELDNGSQDSLSPEKSSKKSIHTKASKSRHASAEKELQDAALHFLKPTFTQQIKSVMQTKSAADLDLKVNFSLKTQLNFGMTCLIINYANEVLYVHKISAEHENPIYELRVKPLRDITPQDRIKFKLVDILNPSNPSALKFGDQFWLQNLDSDETKDNSISQGVVITTKLFELPSLQPVKFELNRVKLHGSHSQKHHSSSSFSGAVDSNNLSRNSFIHNSFNQNSIKSISRIFSSNSLSSSSTDGVLNHGYNRTNTSNSISANAVANATSFEEQKRQMEDTKVSKICGFLDLTRITSKSENEQASQHEVPSNRSASRYAAHSNSKQAVHMGKFSMKTALRPDQIDKKLAAEIKDGYLYSLSPIIIQQDHYCISSAHPNEVSKWPPQSMDVVSDSKIINKEMAKDMNERYMKFLEEMRHSGVLPPSLEKMYTREHSSGKHMNLLVLEFQGDTLLRFCPGWVVIY